MRLAAVSLVVMLVTGSAPAQPQAGIAWLEVGARASWETSSYFADVQVFVGRAFGEDSVYVWTWAYDRKRRYECAGYTELRTGQYIQDPTFSIAILDVPNGYCGPTRVTWRASAKPFVPWAEQEAYQHGGDVFAYGASGFGRQAAAEGAIGYRRLGATGCAALGFMLEGYAGVS